MAGKLVEKFIRFNQGGTGKMLKHAPEHVHATHG